MRFFIAILIILFIELYTFKGVWVLTANVGAPWRKIILWSFWVVTLACWGSIIYVFSQRSQFALTHRSYDLFNFIAGFFIILFTTKLIFAAFHLIHDIAWVIRYIVQSWGDKPKGESHESLTRLQFFNQAGFALSTVWLGLNLYGVTRWKFSYRSLQETLTFPDLPEAFDGMRIVHISDLHLGSFAEQFDSVQKGFDLINSLDADYIFFTGDMVNNFADEAEPWIERLNGLNARHGKFSILGNHDYGDYALGDYPEEKARSFNRLVAIHGEAGFRLLRNENVTIARNGQTIKLIGSENWGLGFHQYGDLEKSLEGTLESDFRILLSHDPTHWQEHVIGQEVLDNNDSVRKGDTKGPLLPPKQRIALTLSGHTHGAQFGVELPSLGIKFSPVQIRYKRWGGLYEEAKQYLYINRGFGYLGFPGRVGMPPEITLIELRRG